VLFFSSRLLAAHTVICVVVLLCHVSASCIWTINDDVVDDDHLAYCKTLTSLRLLTTMSNWVKIFPTDHLYCSRLLLQLLDEDDVSSRIPPCTDGRAVRMAAWSELSLLSAVSLLRHAYTKLSADSLTTTAIIH